MNLVLGKISSHCEVNFYVCKLLNFDFALEVQAILVVGMFRFEDRNILLVT